MPSTSSATSRATSSTARRAVRRTATALTALATTAALALGAAGTAQARPAVETKPTKHLDLPLGFQPEGITVDPEQDRFAYLGSRVDGDLVRLDLRTGRVKKISEGPGTASVGLKIDDRDRIFVAGGAGGDVRVVNATNGKVKRTYDLVQGTAFLNDVVLTDDAAWVTDSASAQLFEIPFGRNGRLPKADAVRRVALGGQWVQGAGNNANGITETPDGKALLVINSSSGVLYRVNKKSGSATPVDLGGSLLTNGDGLLLEGTRMFAVQNRLDQIAVVKLDEDGRSGKVKRAITDPDLDVPSTVARSGERLVLPNARFTTPPTPATPYWVTAIGVPQR